MPEWRCAEAAFKLLLMDCVFVCVSSINAKEMEATLLTIKIACVSLSAVNWMDFHRRLSFFNFFKNNFSPFQLKWYP